MGLSPSRRRPSAGPGRQFTGEIDDFGPLEKEAKKAIRKGLKVMCRECQMGVAVAQLALADAALKPGAADPDRSGISFGADYMLSVPEEFSEGIVQCLDEQGRFQFSRWGMEGMTKMSPLWLLKYLPNMPASHLAIYNDFRGPNNSLTLREASANAALGEAYQIILRGGADLMLVGATGTRLHPMKMLHAVQQEEVFTGDGDPAAASRPFDRDRRGMVLGEGAGAVVHRGAFGRPSPRRDDLRRSRSAPPPVPRPAAGSWPSAIGRWPTFFKRFCAARGDATTWAISTPTA